MRQTHPRNLVPPFGKTVIVTVYDVPYRRNARSSSDIVQQTADKRLFAIQIAAGRGNVLRRFGRMARMLRPGPGIHFSRELQLAQGGILIRKHIPSFSGEGRKFFPRKCRKSPALSEPNGPIIGKFAVYKPGDDHDQPIGGDEYPQHQRENKGRLVRDFVDELHRMRKGKLHQKKDSRRERQRRGNARIPGNMQGNGGIIPRLHAENLFKQHSHAHLPEQNEHKHQRAVDHAAQNVIFRGALGQNALLEHPHLRGIVQSQANKK